MLDRLERVNSERELWAAVEAMVREEGFSDYIYIYHNGGTLYHRTTIDPAFYPGPQDDPFLRFCCNNHEVTLTGPEFAQSYTYLGEAERAFIATCSQSGLISGLAIPVSLRLRAGYGGFNLLSDMTRDAFERHCDGRRERLRAACLLAHRRLDEMGVLDGSAALPLEELTGREREIFELLALGLPRKDISDRLGISPHTVGAHSKAIYRKLGIRSQNEAIRFGAKG